MLIRWLIDKKHFLFLSIYAFLFHYIDSSISFPIDLIHAYLVCWEFLDLHFNKNISEEMALPFILLKLINQTVTKQNLTGVLFRLDFFRSLQVAAYNLHLYTNVKFM